MEYGILIGAGLIIALVLLIGIAIALMNLKDVNRHQRSDSSDERKIVQLPSIQSKRTTSNKKIEFGEMTDIKQGPKYSADSYVEIKSAPAQTEHCAYCRQSISKSEGIVCPKCNSQYHARCFKENKNTCEICKWVQP